MTKAFTNIVAVLAFCLPLAVVPGALAQGGAVAGNVAQSTAQGAAESTSENPMVLLPPPTSLQRRLVEYRANQAEKSARRSRWRQSRLRRLTGSGRTAGASGATASNLARGEFEGLLVRRALRAALGSMAAAVAVAAASGDFSQIARAGAGTPASPAVMAGGGAATISTTSTTATSSSSSN